MKINEKIVDLIRPTVEADGYELWGCEYLPQGKHSLLRIYIENKQGITVDDCAKVSRDVSALLDVDDPIHGHYSLEVSSPGLERPLYTMEQFQQHIGALIKVKLSAAIEGQRKLKGLLQGIENDEIILRVEQQELSVPMANIEKANLLMGQ